MRTPKALLAAVLTLGALAAAPPAAAQGVTLKYSAWHPANHWFTTQGINPWIAEVDKVTQGRVKIDTLPKTVGTPPSQFDVVRDGLADMAIIVTGYTPGRFTLAEMGELPFSGNDPVVMSPALDRMYRKHLAKGDEFKGVEVLSIFTISPGHIFTAKRQVRTIDDIKGLKLRSPTNTATQALTLMGAVPILKASTEAYELLASGAIDGSLMLRETVKSTNAVDLLHYGTLIDGGIFHAVLAVVVNADKWKSIPEADRKLVMSVSADKLAYNMGVAYAAADKVGDAAMAEAKYVVEPASPALMSALKAKLAPMEAEWIERAKKKGIADPAAALADFRKEARAAR